MSHDQFKKDLTEFRTTLETARGEYDKMFSGVLTQLDDLETRYRSTAPAAPPAAASTTAPEAAAAPLDLTPRATLAQLASVADEPVRSDLLAFLAHVVAVVPQLGLCQWNPTLQRVSLQWPRHRVALYRSDPAGVTTYSLDGVQHPPEVVIRTLHQEYAPRIWPDLVTTTPKVSVSALLNGRSDAFQSAWARLRRRFTDRVPPAYVVFSATTQRPYDVFLWHFAQDVTAAVSVRPKRNAPGYNWELWVTRPKRTAQLVSTVPHEIAAMLSELARDSVRALGEPVALPFMRQMTRTLLERQVEKPTGYLPELRAQLGAQGVPYAEHALLDSFLEEAGVRAPDKVEVKAEGTSVLCRWNRGEQWVLQLRMRTTAALADDVRFSLYLYAASGSPAVRAFVEEPFHLVAETLRLWLEE